MYGPFNCRPLVKMPDSFKKKFRKMAWAFGKKNHKEWLPPISYATIQALYSKFKI
jgi:hypothetical protein